jgi:type IV pilus assembly protein PilW
MNKIKQQGFSLIELMIATVIGLLLSYAIMEVYVAQTQIYNTTKAQDLIQSAENAITNLVTPVVRSAGFVGCSAIGTVVSNLTGGGSNPIGSLNTAPTMVAGYNGGTNVTITQDNSANDANADDWTPSLDTNFVGSVENSSDVLVVLGSPPGSYPAGITVIDSGSNSFTAQSTSGMALSAGQFGAVSDCVKTSIFQITGVVGTTISHASGSGPYGNVSDTFEMNYQIGSQFIPLQQTAFFIGQGQGGQSSLMRATLSSGTWTIHPLIPGVDVMKVEYGIGSNGMVSQYVTADAVTNWAAIYSIRIGFLLEGGTSSEPYNNHQFKVLDSTVTVPTDNRLRHVYEITINLRNAIS